MATGDGGQMTCGEVRSQTLGYQRCVLQQGHAGDHRSQDRSTWDSPAASKADEP